MTMNKKQKKQIEAARNKITALKQQLAGAKQQPDDPREIPRLEQAIATGSRDQVDPGGELNGTARPKSRQS